MESAGGHLFEVLAAVARVERELRPYPLGIGVGAFKGYGQVVVMVECAGIVLVDKGGLIDVVDDEVEVAVVVVVRA